MNKWYLTKKFRTFSRNNSSPRALNLGLTAFEIIKVPPTSAWGELFLCDILLVP
jgi:hypothetical protein